MFIKVVFELQTNMDIYSIRAPAHLRCTQALDSLFPVKFTAAAFKQYRCNRFMPLGVNLTSLKKLLKCTKDDDICTLRRTMSSISCTKAKLRS
jgi:hypothetical protein